MNEIFQILFSHILFFSLIPYWTVPIYSYV